MVMTHVRAKSRGQRSGGSKVREKMDGQTDTTDCSTLLGWRRGVVVSGVRRMNEVNARRARLLPGWVTVFARVYHLGM